MEDEEDLEFLRLAALKSMSKKEPLIKQTPINRLIPNTRNIGNAIQVLDTVIGLPLKSQINPPFNIYGPPHTQQQQIQHQLIHRPPSLIFSNGRQNSLEPININEKYVPQRIGNNGNWTEAGHNEYVPYVPTKIGPPTLPNVQLSPRSAAFVSQNNDILMRRKGGHSSNSCSRSPQSPRYDSPSYRAHSADRWSKSPSPLKFTAARSPIGWNRRSKSRSPVIHGRERSPIGRRSPRHTKAITRSPQTALLPLHRRLTSRSPPPAKRIHSGSPQPLNPDTRNRYNSPTFNRRSLSRYNNSLSPPPRHPQNNARPYSRSPPPVYGRRVRSPAPRPSNFQNKWRSFSPTNNQQQQPHRGGGVCVQSNIISSRKSPSDISGLTGSPSYRAANNRRRSRSPKTDFQLHGNRRSNSRSPYRKYSKLSSRDRPANNGSNINKRRSPPQGRKFGRGAGGANGLSNNRNNRSRAAVRKSPSSSPVKRKSSKSPLQATSNKLGNIDKSGRLSEKSDIATKKLDTQIDELKITDATATETNNTCSPNIINANTTVITTTTITTNTTTLTVKNKSELEMEEELLASTDDDMNSDKDEGDDEIDLFASEESESENEGRFKSGSSKNERSTTVSTVSFSKLGSASASTVHDLNDVKSDKTFGNDSNRRERDYHRGGGRNNMYSSRTNRDDRFRSRHTNRTSNYKSKNAVKGSADDKKKDEKTMFKSTFQMIENDNKIGKFMKRILELNNINIFHRWGKSEIKRTIK